MNFKLNSVKEKLIDAVDSWYHYAAHAQDNPTYNDETERMLHDNIVERFQDYECVKFDTPNVDELNFSDYEEEVG